MLQRPNPSPTFVNPIRWYPVVNLDAQPAPPYAILQVTGVDTAGNFTVTRPTADSINVFLINGPGTIPPNAYGQATTNAGPCIVGYDEGPLDDEAPNPTEEWGAQSGRWTIGSEQGGLTILGGAGGGLVNVALRAPLVSASCGQFTTLVNACLVSGALYLQYQDHLMVNGCLVPNGQPYCVAAGSDCCPNTPACCDVGDLCISFTDPSSCCPALAGQSFVLTRQSPDFHWKWTSGPTAGPCGLAYISLWCHSGGIGGRWDLELFAVSSNTTIGGTWNRKCDSTFSVTYSAVALFNYLVPTTCNVAASIVTLASVSGACGSSSGSGGGAFCCNLDCTGIPSPLTGTITARMGCFTGAPGTATWACSSGGTNNSWNTGINTGCQVDDNLTIFCVIGPPTSLGMQFTTPGGTFTVMAQPGYTCNPFSAVFLLDDGGGDSCTITLTS